MFNKRVSGVAWVNSSRIKKSRRKRNELVEDVSRSWMSTDNIIK